MTFPLAMLQTGGDQTLVIVLAVVTLGFLIALGKRFFVALFEVVTAPQASLAHHGKENTFFFHFMVVFLGGLIGLVYLTYQQPQISSDFTAIAKETGTAVAQANSNPNYRDVAGAWAGDRIDNALQTYVVGNFIWFPVFMILSWIVNGLIFWACTKMFGVQTTLPAFLGALSFAYFFSSISTALSLAGNVKQFTSMLYSQTPSSSADIALIIAGVLGLYSIILFCMGVVQSAEITAGQFIIIVLLLAILGGGLSYYMQSQQFMPQAEAFVSEIRSFDPAKTGAAPPPPPPPSAPSNVADGMTGGSGGATPEL